MGPSSGNRTESPRSTRLRRSVTPICALVVLIAAGASTPQRAALAAATAAVCGWVVVPSADVGSNPDVLSGVAAVNRSDAWAVGSLAHGSVSHTLAERWDGATWSIVATQNVGTATNTFTAVAALNHNQAWAVGFYNDGSTFRTLAERWDGSSWRVVATPNVGTDENVLTAVAIVASDDVWAVGYHYGVGTYTRVTLAEHWDGSSWRVVSTPNVGADENFLWSVSAISGADIWAVGSYSVPWFQTLTEHWDGASWTVVPSPNLGNGDNVLYAAVALGPASIAAVGTWLNGDVTDTLAQHGNGTTWDVTRTPSPAGYLNFLTGVAADGPSDLWAVGWGTSVPFGTARTMGQHWDGRRWSVGRTANVGSDPNQLATVAHIPGTTAFWAVGHYELASLDRTLVEFHC